MAIVPFRGRPQLVIVATGLLAGVLLIFTRPVGGDFGPVSRANFDRVQVGMSLEEVKAIFGPRVVKGTPRGSVMWGQLSARGDCFRR